MALRSLVPNHKTRTLTALSQRVAKKNKRDKRVKWPKRENVQGHRPLRAGSLPSSVPSHPVRKSAYGRKTQQVTFMNRDFLTFWGIQGGKLCILPNKLPVLPLSFFLKISHQ